MAEDGAPRWLVVDGYEDEPAAFGVPPYVGFHVRYLCGVLEAHGVPYDYLTVDAWRALGRRGEDAQRAMLDGRAGLALLAGAVVPGKYLRATPISLPETKALLRMLPADVPAVLGGWAIRGWRHQGWSPLRRGLFLALYLGHLSEKVFLVLTFSFALVHFFVVLVVPCQLFPLDLLHYFSWL